jgi:hypothetical protein
MDEDPDVRKLVCQGLVALMQNVPERLQPHLRQVVQYMLERNQARVLFTRDARARRPLPSLTALPPFVHQPPAVAFVFATRRSATPRLRWSRVSFGAPSVRRS